MSEQTQERKPVGSKIGVVVSDARDKTRTVAVEYREVHPKYGKSVRRTAKFHVHDENNESQNGDRVEIVSCRPLSKTKSFKIAQILEKAVSND